MIEPQEEHKSHVMESMQLEIMNTSFYIAVSNSHIPDWKTHISSWLQYVEQAFSRFRQNNELWNLNLAGKNERLQVSPVLFDILQKAEDYRKKTEGRFSPFILNQLEAHGYSRSFPFTNVQKGNFQYVEKWEEQPFIFHKNYEITKNTNQKIDLGGIAKGYAVEAAGKWLQERAKSKYGIVDGGGDMSLWSDGEKTWKIGIMNPFHEDKEVGHFNIQNGGIATSNVIYRSWLQDGTKKHHLLDGRTGEPVHSSIVQATVVMEHCLDAEIGAKICFMNDGRSLNSILNKLTSDCKYMVVYSNENIEMG